MTGAVDRVPGRPATVLVTGATDGIGRAVAGLLVRQGSAVVVHGRAVDRVERTCRELRALAPAARVSSVVADFADLRAVRTVTEELTGWPGGLDGLVNNAGVFPDPAVPERRPRSADGVELTWAVNYLAAFVLTMGLVPVLRRSAAARIVNVSSGQHRHSTIRWGDPQLRHGWEPMAAYAQSKLALTMFGAELAHRLAGTGVTVNSVNPGFTRTKLVRDIRLGAPPAPVAGAARAVADLLLDPAMATRTGCYVDRATVAEAHPLVTDPAARRRLWELTERQLAAAAHTDPDPDPDPGAGR